VVDFRLAHVAGMLISRPEYRYQVETISPFRDVLLASFSLPCMKLNIASVFGNLYGSAPR
jgi:hypothetical protein